MKKLEIMNMFSGTLNKVGFKLKKHSPEILVAAGVVGTVVSAVMACKATTKVSAILDETKNTLDSIHECAGNPDLADRYTVEDAKKDTTIIYAQTALKFIKLYGPSVLLGAASLSCIIKSNSILRKRNVALAAAYATVDKSFKEYRGRVVERFGKEIDKELKYNIKSKEIEETVTDEKGKEKKVKKTIDVVDPSTISDFAKFFDSSNINWEDDPEYNLMFLKAQQSYANDLLRTRKHLYLNEVYDLLGIDRTKAGQIVGWIYNEENPVGDNFVDFGIYDTHKQVNRDFVNGYEPVILLDFNVDGNILDKM